MTHVASVYAMKFSIACDIIHLCMNLIVSTKMFYIMSFDGRTTSPLIDQFQLTTMVM